MKQPAPYRALALAALSIFVHAGSAHAQYAWTDEHGVRQYSDRPPPPSVPRSRILRQPGGAPAPAKDAPEPAAPAAQAAAPAPAPATTLAEKNAEFRKRQAERAEKEKKAAEEARMAADRRQSCARAANYQRALDSGARIGVTGPDGQRSYLSDEQRAREAQETRRVLAGCD